MTVWESSGCTRAVNDLPSSFAWISQHPFRRGRDVGDAEIGFDHRDQIPGLVDQRPEPGGLDGVRLPNREAEPDPGHQEGDGGQRNGWLPHVPETADEEDGDADGGAEGRQAEPATRRCRVLDVAGSTQTATARRASATGQAAPLLM